MAGGRGVGGLYGGGFGVGGDVGCWFDAKGVSCSSSSSLPLDGFFVSGSSSSFLGSSSIVNFEDVCGRKRSDRSFFGGFPDETGDDDLDDYFHHPEKKRRLTAEQVQFLERSFEAENKLEPERKVQLAKDLGLQPRQVAIWFQNRRARWKTKQLEQDFDTLQTSYNSLKADYENLLKEKEKLKAEVLRLTDKLHLKEKEEEQLEPSNMYSNQPETPQQGLIVGSALEDDDAPPVSVLAVKHEDPSSTKSDELDSDNFCHVDAGAHLSFVEPGDSSHVIEHEHSDISQDEEDNLSNTLMPDSYLFPKMESAGDYPESPAYSCNFGLQVEDHATWFWSS